MVFFSVLHYYARIVRNGNRNNRTNELDQNVCDRIAEKPYLENVKSKKNQANSEKVRKFWKNWGKSFKMLN